MEARRYRQVARRLDRLTVKRALRFKPHAVERLLSGHVRFLTLTQAGRIEALCSRRTRAWLRESPRYNLMAGELPSTLIVPLILEAFAQHGQAATETMVGVPTRSLFRIVTDSSGVSFEIADRIVTNLDSPDWWRGNSERYGWYWSADARLSA